MQFLEEQCTLRKADMPASTRIVKIPELMFLIASFLEEDSAYQSIASCLLVSKQFHVIFEPFLYKTIDLRRIRPPQPIDCVVLPGESQPRLPFQETLYHKGHLVRSVHAEFLQTVVDSPSSTPYYTGLQLHFSHLSTYLLPYCYELESLHIYQHGSSVPYFQQEYWDHLITLIQQNRRTLKSLTIEMNIRMIFPTAVWEAISDLQDLVHLSVSGVTINGFLEQCDKNHGGSNTSNSPLSVPPNLEAFLDACERAESLLLENFSITTLPVTQAYLQDPNSRWQAFGKRRRKSKPFKNLITLDDFPSTVPLSDRTNLLSKLNSSCSSSSSLSTSPSSCHIDSEWEPEIALARANAKCRLDQEHQIQRRYRDLKSLRYFGRSAVELTLFRYLLIQGSKSLTHISWNTRFADFYLPARITLFVARCLVDVATGCIGENNNKDWDLPARGPNGEVIDFGSIAITDQLMPGNLINNNTGAINDSNNSNNNNNYGFTPHHAYHKRGLTSLRSLELWDGFPFTDDQIAHILDSLTCPLKELKVSESGFGTLSLDALFRQKGAVEKTISELGSKNRDKDHNNTADGNGNDNTCGLDNRSSITEATFPGNIGGSSDSTGDGGPETIGLSSQSLPATVAAAATWKQPGYFRLPHSSALEKLDLTSCPDVTEEMVQEIRMHCPNLKELILTSQD
ncbi:hypothetical protein BX616_003452 [Lobosporangium transversale]|uniref:F-box domain-containing protein n=1 Tax=Lobosporangium transversale TaxID=64571 RepID=A0A1Y2GEL1_9FUNG|nr:hypothetical protein BCR41DRAFT_358942 [Lobosporangium transversale]KAF9898924.1 hypothetical protein BX616_003452 [Lobosporangium transversale]ORZ08742.1 hypothetical protein BCR41DRAFT_358942 [Lobosporangium transversale]|eukprot:XP_021878525.1 hypothetical protein BCR41DRAFT_358942 [Lobosporangium transversale]